MVDKKNDNLRLIVLMLIILFFAWGNCYGQEMIYKKTQAEYDATYPASGVVYIITDETIFDHSGLISFAYMSDGKYHLLSTNYEIIANTNHDVEFVMVGKLKGVMFYSAIINLKL